MRGHARASERQAERERERWGHSVFDGRYSDMVDGGYGCNRICGARMR